MKILLLSICTLFLLGCEVPSRHFEGAKRFEKPQKVQIDLKDQTVTINKQNFTVEIADEPAERRQGLMNVKSIPQDTGMLFVFENEAVYPFWMKNTLIPLTMIWIDTDLNIVDIQDAEPCKVEKCPNYVPSGKAKYVLEVNKGILKN